MRAILKATIILFSAAVTGACDQPSSAPSPDHPRGNALKAADASCALPLENFAPHRRRIVGSILDYPTNLVAIDQAGQLRWNSELVSPQQLSVLIEHQARMEPPILLVIQPDRSAPCAVVRDTLSAAMRKGQCTQERCAFEWPNAMSPPAPTRSEAP